MISTQRDSGGKDRAQTTLDFAFGIGIFLITVAFIFIFVPNLVAPFNTPSESGEKIQAERTADYLVTDTLGGNQNNSHATTLDPACTDAFFERNELPDRCDPPDDIKIYPGSEDELDPTALGLSSSTHVRIELESLDTGTTYSVGESANSQNVQQWTRLVYYTGEEYKSGVYKLRVKLW